MTSYRSLYLISLVLYVSTLLIEEFFYRFVPDSTIYNLTVIVHFMILIFVAGVAIWDLKSRWHV
jgi:hypothetical protein